MAMRRGVAVVDENLIGNGDGRIGGIKKTTTATTTTTRRAALSNLVNRGEKPRVPNDKKAIIQIGTNETTSVPSAIDLKNVKPRVDTHWKNDQKKPLVRNATMKKITIAVNQTKALKTKSTETAINEATLIDKPIGLKPQDNTTNRRKIIVNGQTDAKIPVTKTESEEENISSSATTDALVHQSRFRPASSGSYSNGFINGMDALNIDDGDEDNTLLVCEYVNDIYSYLFSMERQYAICKNHLHQQKEVIPRMRAVLLDWISEVHTQYHFAQETFHITVSLIDRYLQAVNDTSKKNLQLVGVAALFIASKYEELYPPEIKDFVYITDNTYSKDDILRMEQRMLKKLKFELGAPTTIHFLRRFSKAAQANTETHTLAKYFIELSSIDYNLSEYLPSEIAAASLFLSLFLMHSMEQTVNDIQSLWTPALKFYSTYDVDHLRSIVIKLIAYAQLAPTSKTNNVFVKYRSSKHYQVSLMIVKYEKSLEKLIVQDW